MKHFKFRGFSIFDQLVLSRDELEMNTSLWMFQHYLKYFVKPPRLKQIGWSYKKAIKWTEFNFNIKVKINFNLNIVCVKKIQLKNCTIQLTYNCYTRNNELEIICEENNNIYLIISSFLNFNNKWGVLFGENRINSLSKFYQLLIKKISRNFFLYIKYNPDTIHNQNICLFIFFY